MRRRNNETTLSAFNDDTVADAETLMKCCSIIFASYPAVFGRKKKEELNQWVEVFSMAVKFKATQGDVFGNERLMNATLDCIASKHQYGEIQIADILSYKKEIKLYTYTQAKCGLDGTKYRTFLVDTQTNGWWFTDNDTQSIETATRMAKELGTYGKDFMEAKRIMDSKRK